MKMLLKSGTVEALSSYNGVDGEMVINMGASDLRVMDGVTPGGHSVTNINFIAGDIEVAAPLNNSYSVPTQPIIQTSEYVGVGAHIATYWQLATDAAFTNIVYSSGRDTVNLTSLNCSQVNIVLDIATRYYIRAKYESNYSVITDWSAPAYFTTRIGGVEGIEVAKIMPFDVAAGDYYGRSVAISSDGATIAVGAWGDDDMGSNSGSVYIFRKFGNQWNQFQKLVPYDGIANDQYGQNLALSADGSVLLVSALGGDVKGSNSGEVYVYMLTALNDYDFNTKIYPADGAAGDSFSWGINISSDGKTAIIGAYTDDNTGVNSGSAYVFVRTGDSPYNSTWAQQAKLVASDAAAEDFFGRDVAISANGNVVVASSIYDNGNGVNNSGAIYMYIRTGTTWSQACKVIHPDLIADEEFGRGVSISGDGLTVAVGAWKHQGVGSVFIYNRVGNSLVFVTKLFASDGQLNDAFGMSTALTIGGNKLIVGAYGSDTGAVNAGAAYVFGRIDGVWSQQAKLTASDANAESYFGLSVALSSNVAVIGGYHKDNDTGSAYVFI